MLRDDKCVTLGKSGRVRSVHSRIRKGVTGRSRGRPIDSRKYRRCLLVGLYCIAIAGGYVRMRKSVWRLCVDMLAIVSAIYAHAGHELRLLRWAMNRSKPGNRGFKINQSAAFSTFLVDS
jgi:hypothetical protein